MQMARAVQRQKDPNGLAALQYSIDFVTAILLLSGQLTTAGIFVVPEGFFLGATGPVLGGELYEGKTDEAAAAMKSISVVSAILLILNVIRVTGIYVTSGRAFIVFSGEIFGIKEIAGTVGMEELNQNKASTLRSYLRSELLSIHKHGQ